MNPRILIFGQPFNDFSGGGITLTNLFKGWEKGSIAVAFIGHGLYNVTTEICDIVYQLGGEEHKWIFPFNIIQRKFPSGIKTFDPKTPVPYNFIQTGLRYKLVNRYFYPFLTWIGIFHTASKLSLSDKLKDWLKEYNPEILYLQVSTREEIIFSLDLIGYLKIPSVIHMMDDWPMTISNKGIFKKYWHNRIDREFRILLDHVDLHLSISSAMSEEYLKRYDKEFVAFHNPIETTSWLPFSKKDFTLRDEYVSILYSGRIGMGITESIYEVADAIDSLNEMNFKIRLRIQTPTKDERILNPLRKYKCVVINPFAELDQLPGIFSRADLLLLANDFSVQGLDFLRFSMPTKASEYMISGTPILVYSPEETAVSRFFIQNECGYCITRQDKNEIMKAIQFLLEHDNYRAKLSSRAINLARSKFSASKVREEFQGLLTKQLSQKGSHKVSHEGSKKVDKQ